MRRPHVGPHDPRLLNAGVGLQLDVLAETRLLLLRRKIDTLPGHIVLPAVIWAAQPALLILPKPERDAAVRAKFIDQTNLSLAVAKTNQALAHKLRTHGRAI